MLHYADTLMREDNSFELSELDAMDMFHNLAHPGVQSVKVPINKSGDLFKTHIGRVSSLPGLADVGYANDDCGLLQTAKH